MLALYLNVLVGVVQTFQKLSFLHALAPNGSEPLFIVAQTIVLLIFVLLGFMTVRKFHPVRSARNLALISAMPCSFSLSAAA